MPDLILICQPHSKAHTAIGLRKRMLGSPIILKQILTRHPHPNCLGRRGRLVVDNINKPCGAAIESFPCWRELQSHPGEAVTESDENRIAFRTPPGAPFLKHAPNSDRVALSLDPESLTSVYTLKEGNGLREPRIFLGRGGTAGKEALEPAEDGMEHGVRQIAERVTAPYLLRYRSWRGGGTSRGNAQ